MLTSTENGKLSGDMLLELAKAADPGGLDPIVEECVPLLASGSDAEVLIRAWERIFDDRTTVGRRLRANAAFVTLASDLRTNFVLYLPALATEAGVRHIVKVAFDSPRPAPKPRGLRARLGWSPAVDRFQVPLAGYCASYHCELEAPPEMEITRGVFVAFRSRKPCTHRVDRAVTRVHFNLSRLDRAGGIVSVSLRARSRDFLGGTVLLSFINAFALWFAFAKTQTLAAASTNVDPVAGALLAVPGLLIGYMTRPGEHEVLSDFLGMVRIVAVAGAILSFVAALFIATKSRAHTSEWAVGLCAAGALVCALMLAGTFFAGRSNG